MIEIDHVKYNFFFSLYSFLLFNIDWWSIKVFYFIFAFKNRLISVHEFEN